MNLPNLNLLSLTFRLQARDSAALPPFLGSTLRGAFGTALKKVFCFVPHGECARCWFFEACPYQYLFESPNLIPKEENHKLLRGQKEVPQPFVLISPIPTKKIKKQKVQKELVNFNEDYAGNHFSRGETLEFSILLMGKATRFWAQVLVAVRLFAANGLGDERIPFLLVEAFAHDALGKSVEVFNIKDSKVLTHKVSPIPLNWITNLRVQTLKNELDKIPQSNLKIVFQTPTRIRIADQVSESITFFDLLKKITERLELLAFLHAETSQKIDYRPLLSVANNFSLADGGLKLYRFEQFSNTQNGKTKRDVVLGQSIIRGDNIMEILPFLAAGEIVNVGANTSYGFGKFIVEIRGRSQK